VNDSPDNARDPVEAARAQARRARERSADRGPTDPGQIGPYNIVARLGSGGMGVVYLAEHGQTGAPAAVKVLRPGLASGSAARRFAQEIEILQSLEHPGIARILDAGPVQVGGHDRLYCAMEYIAGRHIIRHADINALDVQARLKLFLFVCDALAYAHARGVIHRDLKPHNILVEMGSKPRIVDFGVARWAQDGRTTMHTEIGQILGTVQYMSPEQIQGRHDELDERTDIYALGVVLFELLTGELPYEVDPKDPIETMRAIRAGRARSPRQVNDQLPKDIERVVMCAMALEPGRRYVSADALGDDIRRAIEGDAVLCVVPPDQARRGLASKIGRIFTRRPSGDEPRE
jgi:eukaryotic-like serine/threonine-protein kinase